MSIADYLLTVLEATQLVALAPCFFLIAYLLLMARPRRRALVPVLYFTILSTSFFLLLASIWGRSQHPNLYGALLFGESLQPAFSFLLIIQLLIGRVPNPIYWLILALPVIGGSSLVYASITLENLCLTADYCVNAAAARTLYSIFSACLIFLLLMVHFSRKDVHISPTDHHRRHKYWLIIALVSLNLFLLMLDLASVAGKFNQKEVWLSATIIRISFMYVVLTSLFRIFEHGETLVTQARKKPEEPDAALLARIRNAMETQRIYREMGFNRERFAKHLGLSEHHLSRVINSSFDKNINEFVNGYRIAEAKARLAAETTPITVIAFEVGFNSIASFNRVFREMAGCSPTEFRAANTPEPKTA